MTCCSCKKEKPIAETTLCSKGRLSTKTGTRTPDSRRCNVCNSQKAKLDRLWVSRRDLHESWSDTMTLADKADFLAEHGDQSSPDLEKRLNETVAKIKRRVKSDDFVATGTYIHKTNVETKYKDKPDQLQYILEVGKKLEACGTTLYEDLVFTSVVANKTEEVDERKLNLSTEERIKRARPKKTPKTPGEPADKKLKRSTVTKLQKLKEKIDDTIANMEVTEEDGQKAKVMENVPAAMHQKQAELLALLKSDAAGVDLLFEQGKETADVEVNLKRFDSALKQANEQQSVYKAQVEYFV